MSALTAIETADFDTAEFQAKAATGQVVAGSDAARVPGRRDFYLVEAVSPAVLTPSAGVGRRTELRHSDAFAARRAPVRLTRRGRIVVAIFAVAVATVVITVLAMAGAGGAQAANHGKAGAGYQGLRQIVVQPGQTLWTIAARAEPSADPRLVVAQIMAANSMTSTVLQAGQLLWVPK